MLHSPSRLGRSSQSLLSCWLAAVLLAVLSPLAGAQRDFESEYLLSPRYRGEDIGGLTPTILPAGEQPPLVLAEEVLDAIGAEFSVREDGGLEGRRHPGAIPFAFRTDGRWRVNGDGGRLAENHFRVLAGELYLSPEALGRAFPLELEVQTRQQRLLITALGPLPRDLARMRERRRTRLRGDVAPDPPILSSFPYRLMGRPAGDIRADVTHRKGSTRETTMDYDGLVAGEVAYGTGLMFFRGDDEALEDVRLRLGRESATGNAWGVPGLVSGFAGDVNSAALPLVGSLDGRGLALSAYPLQRPDSFDQTTLEGDAPAGWEVELYRDDELLAFGRVGPDGRYRFVDVPLLFGDNDLRLVFIGPEGQIREQTRNFNVGANMTPPGRLYWHGMVGQYNQRLLEDLLPDRQGVTGDVYALEGELGLGRHLSAGLFASRAPENYRVDSELVDTRGAMVRLALSFTALQLDVATQADGGRAWNLAGTAGIGRLNLSVRHSQYEDFRSRRATRGIDPLESESRLRLHLPVTLGGRSVSFYASGERWDLASGETETLLRGGARFRVAGIYLDQEVEWRERDFSSGRRQLERLWLPSASLNRGPLRLSLDGRYDLDSRTLEQVQLVGNWRFDPETTASFGLSRHQATAGNASWRAMAGLSRYLGTMRVSLTVSGSGSDDYFVGLGLNTSFGMDRGGRLRFDSRPLAEWGAADVLVYHDRDFDGRYDPARDELLPGAELAVNGYQSDVGGTDERGRAFVAGLDTHRPASLDIAPESIPDPFLVPARGGVRFVPRPGQPYGAEMPLVDSGEISGYLVAERNGEELALANVLLELVRIYPEGERTSRGRGAGLQLVRRDGGEAGDGKDADQSREYHDGYIDGTGQGVRGNGDQRERVVQIVRSQFDGSYLFDRVAPGRYHVRIRAGQVIRGAKLEPVTVAATVSSDDLFVNDLELRLLSPEDTARRPRVLQRMVQRPEQGGNPVVDSSPRPPADAMDWVRDTSSARDRRDRAEVSRRAQGDEDGTSQLVFGSFRNAGNAVAFSVRLDRTLSVRVFVAKVHREDGIWYRVVSARLAQKEREAVAAEAREQGMSPWTVQEQLPQIEVIVSAALSSTQVYP